MPCFGTRVMRGGRRRAGPATDQRGSAGRWWQGASGLPSWRRSCRCTREARRRGERVRRRLVAGEKKRDQLIAHFALAEPRPVALVVARVDQDLEQIALRFVLAATLLDDAVHHGVERGERAAERAPARRGQER